MVITFNMNQEILAVCATYVILSSICFLCVTTTVISTKSVRNQLLGAMLINLAVGNYLRNIFYMHQAELAYLGKKYATMSVFGASGCYFHLSILHVFKIIISTSIVVLLFDVVLNFPQNRKSQILVTVVIWVVAVIFSVGIMHKFEERPHCIRKNNQCCLLLRKPQWIFEWLSFLTFDGLPSLLIVVTVIKFFTLCNINAIPRSKTVPFFLTIMLYLILVWTVDILVLFRHFEFFRATNINYASYLLWPHLIQDCGRVLISLIWLFLTPDLRNRFLCKKVDLSESTEVSLQSNHSLIVKIDGEEECDNDTNSKIDKRNAFELQSD